MQLLMATNNVNRDILNVLRSAEFGHNINRSHSGYDLLIVNNEGACEVGLEGTIIAMVPKDKAANVGVIGSINPNQLLHESLKLMHIYKKHNDPQNRTLTKVTCIVKSEDDMPTKTDTFVDIKNKDKAATMLVDFFLKN